MATRIAISTSSFREIREKLLAAARQDLVGDDAIDLGSGIVIVPDQQITPPTGTAEAAAQMIEHGGGEPGQIVYYDEARDEDKITEEMRRVHSREIRHARELEEGSE